MKIQIKFEVEATDGSVKKVTKTFSKINEKANIDQCKEFAGAYISLINTKKAEAYLITEEIL